MWSATESHVRPVRVDGKLLEKVLTLALSLPRPAMLPVLSVPLRHTHTHTHTHTHAHARAKAENSAQLSDQEYYRVFCQPSFLSEMTAEGEKLQIIQPQLSIPPPIASSSPPCRSPQLLFTLHWRSWGSAGGEGGGGGGGVGGRRSNAASDAIKVGFQTGPNEKVKDWRIEGNCKWRINKVKRVARMSWLSFR